MISTIAMMVIQAVSGAARKPEVSLTPQAALARLKPISITMVPVITGGIRASIQAEPARCTTPPTMASRMPASMMPNSALPMSPSTLEASTGEMKAKEEPR